MMFDLTQVSDSGPHGPLVYIFFSPLQVTKLNEASSLTKSALASYENSSQNVSSLLYESLEELNSRYANALIPNVVILGVFVTIGVLGNSLVLLVFTQGKQYNNSNFRIFVICLAIIDILTCVILIPAEIVKIRSHFSFHSSILCKTRCFLNTFETSVAAFTLLLISVDRYRKVCQPLKTQILSEQAIKILCLIVLISFLISLPAPVMCGISTTEKTNKYNTTTIVYMCFTEKAFENSIWRIIYKCMMTLCMIVVSVTLTAMYSAIGRTVIQHLRSKTNRLDNFQLGFRRMKKKSKKYKIQVNELNFRTCNPDGPKMKVAKKTIKRKEDKTSIGENTHSFSVSSTSVHGSVTAIEEIRNVSGLSDYCSGTYKTGSRQIPYKTTIWCILTLLFIVTYLIYAVLTFIVPSMSTMEPESFMIYYLFYRLYFINNIINPFIYACLDKRFQVSCRNFVAVLRRKL